MKKIIYLLLLLFVFVSVASVNVFAANYDANLIVTNPGEDMSTMVNISWHTEIDGTFVKYSVDGDTSNVKTVNGECAAIPFKGKETVKQCKATLTDLTPNTVYKYSVGKNIMSSEYKFTTAGTGDFSFIHMTDIHSYTPIATRVGTANSVIQKAKEIQNDLEFVLFSGDVTAYGAYYDQWENLYKMDSADELMYAFTPGNHDYYDVIDGKATTTNISYFNAMTNNPNNGAEGVKGSSYFFKYGNALFISIDSEDAYIYRTTKLQGQIDWVKTVIRENPADFIIAYCHKPFYTGNGGSGTQTKFVVENFSPLFDEAGVDLVLTGDNHILARSHPMYNKQVVNTEATGTVYIVGPQIGDRPVGAGTVPAYIAYTEGGKMDAGTIVTVKEDRILLNTMDITGKSLSTFEIKSKSSTINKTTLEASLNINSDEEDFSKATLSFEDQGAGRVVSVNLKDKDGKEIGNYYYPNNSINIEGIPNVAEYKVTVEMLLRTNEVITKDINLVNEKFFGSISDVSIDGSDPYKTFIKWSGEINDRIAKFEIYVNGVLDKEVASDVRSAELKIGPFKKNDLKFNAIDIDGNIVYTKEFTYGELSDDIYVDFSTTEVEVKKGEKTTLEYDVHSDAEQILEFKSSDENVATVNDKGEVTAVGVGECTISVNIAKRWETGSTIIVKVVEAPVVVPEPEKKGCFNSSSIIPAIAALGFILIYRRRGWFIK